MIAIRPQPAHELARSSRSLMCALSIFALTLQSPQRGPRRPPRAPGTLRRFPPVAAPAAEEPIPPAAGLAGLILRPVHNLQPQLTHRTRQRIAIKSLVRPASAHPIRLAHIQNPKRRQIPPPHRLPKLRKQPLHLPTNSGVRTRGDPKSKPPTFSSSRRSRSSKAPLRPPSPVPKFTLLHGHPSLSEPIPSGPSDAPTSDD